MTNFFKKMIKERGEPVATTDLNEVARMVKEDYAYCVKDLLKEMEKFDNRSKKYKRMKI